MNNRIPDYLVEKKNIIRFLIFTALFSLVFINIYKPFGSIYWQDVSQTIFFLISGLVVIIGIVILIGSRIIMFRSREKFPLNYWQYFTWIVIELTLISLAYTFLTRFALGINEDFITIFVSAFSYTVLVLSLPYILSWLFFALRDAEKVISRMTQEENFIDLGGEKSEQLINFRDEKGNLRFSVSLANLLFIESADNYVEIYYLQKGKVNRFVLRNSLKVIEENYGNNVLVRCHRSYMINFSKVKVLRKDKEGIFLEMDIEDLPDIPVSKTYTERITQLFAKHS